MHTAAMMGNDDREMFLIKLQTQRIHGLLYNLMMIERHIFCKHLSDIHLNIPQVADKLNLAVCIKENIKTSCWCICFVQMN